VAGVQVLGHFFLEHLLQNGLHALADSGLDVQLHVVLELVVFRGQVSPSSLNPQLTRRYLIPWPMRDQVTTGPADIQKGGAEMSKCGASPS
jgi:hypothetical protein